MQILSTVLNLSATPLMDQRMKSLVVLPRATVTIIRALHRRCLASRLAFALLRNVRTTTVARKRSVATLTRVLQARSGGTTLLLFSAPTPLALWQTNQFAVLTEDLATTFRALQAW
jgi:hypothetical protein